MANISSINGNPIVPSNGSVGTAQVAPGYNLMTDDEKSKLGGVPAQGNTPFSSINGNPIVVGTNGISDGSVTGDKLANGSIGDDKLEQSGGILSLVRAIDDKLTRISQGDGGGIADDSVAAAALRAEDAAERAEAAAKSVDLTGYLKSADAEATYAPKSHKHAMADVTGLQAALDAIGAATASEVSALRTRMDDAESSIAHLAGRLPIYYYTDVPSESSITEKPQLAVIKGGAVYLVE